MANLFELSNRVAVVMGATSGIGRTLAVGLAEHGATVVPTGRREDRLREICSEVEAWGGKTICKTADVCDRGTIDAFRDAVLAEFGRVDILLNAAGVTFKQPTATVSEEQWSSLMNTDLTGVLRACQSFYEPLKASGRGRIINIASLGSYRAFYQVAAY